MIDEEIWEVMDKLSIIDKMYEMIRFVDPFKKKIIKYHNNQLCEMDIDCFNIWGKNKICDNCISIRAYNENKSYVKIEYSSDKIYMVTAIPYVLKERKIVIELFKDTTSSMIFSVGEHKNTSEVYNLIDYMNNLALKDELTGVFNRRYINEKLPIDLIKAVMSDRNLSIIMADVDYFKKVNDNYGHLAGDSVLKSITNIITRCINNENEWIARFGGEEFLICLPGINRENAIKVAETIRINIENSIIKYNDEIIKVTTSFGICSVKPHDGFPMEKLIEEADRKLYNAKNNGRNRVEW